MPEARTAELSPRLRTCVRGSIVSFRLGLLASKAARLHDIMYNGVIWGFSHNLKRCFGCRSFTRILRRYRRDPRGHHNSGAAHRRGGEYFQQLSYRTADLPHDSPSYQSCQDPQDRRSRISGLNPIRLQKELSPDSSFFYWLSPIYSLCRTGTFSSPHLSLPISSLIAPMTHSIARAESSCMLSGKPR